MVLDRILQRGAALRVLINAGKAWVMGVDYLMRNLNYEPDPVVLVLLFSGGSCIHSTDRLSLCHLGFGTHPLGGDPVLAEYMRARDMSV
jgi:hypothetical protein